MIYIFFRCMVENISKLIYLSRKKEILNLDYSKFLSVDLGVSNFASLSIQMGLLQSLMASI
jgi:hypothetical protein